MSQISTTKQDFTITKPFQRKDSPFLGREHRRLAYECSTNPFSLTFLQPRKERRWPCARQPSHTTARSSISPLTAACNSLVQRSSEGNEGAWQVWDQPYVEGLPKRRKLDLTTQGHKIGRASQCQKAMLQFPKSAGLQGGSPREHLPFTRQLWKKIKDQLLIGMYK